MLYVFYLGQKFCNCHYHQRKCVCVRTGEHSFPWKSRRLVILFSQRNWGFIHGWSEQVTDFLFLQSSEERINSYLSKIWIWTPLGGMKGSFLLPCLVHAGSECAGGEPDDRKRTSSSSKAFPCPGYSVMGEARSFLQPCDHPVTAGHTA